MKKHDSTTIDIAEAISLAQPAPSMAGLAWGAAGVLAFSLSLPMTRLAVSKIDPALVGLGRAVAAGGLAMVWLAARGAGFPPRDAWPRLGLVALGVVLGFPLFSSIALRFVDSAHAAVITGLLPVSTAIMAVLRAGERPSASFWASAALGLAAVLVFAAVQGAGAPELADGLIVLAVLCAGFGYAEGGALSRAMGGPRVIAWALVLSLPVLLPATALRLAIAGWPSAHAAAWAGFAYVSAVSMFFGFFAWYRGLALGGVARIGQMQLAQPVLTLIWAALLLGERISLATGAAAAAVLASAVLTQMTRA